MDNRSSDGVGEDIRIALSNRSQRKVVISLQIQTEGKPIFDEKISILEGREQVDPNIEGRGEYTFELSTDTGLTKEFVWVVEEYDLREGSDMIIGISEEEIQFLIEE